MNYSKNIALKVKPSVDVLDNGINDGARARMMKDLRIALSNTCVLMFKTQSFHWNFVGTAFLGLHALTDEQYKNMFAAIDDLGERIRELGFPAPHSLSGLVGLATVNEEMELATSAEMIDVLVRDHEVVAEELRPLVAKAEGLDDVVTADLVTQRIAFHEKAAWVLRSVGTV